MGKKIRDDGIECDPKRGDAILKRMLQSKPKTHEEMVRSTRKKPAKSKTNAGPK